MGSDYKLDKTLVKYYWREHRSLANVAHSGWTTEFKDKHQDLIDAWQEFKTAQLKLNNLVIKL